MNDLVAGMERDPCTCVLHEYRDKKVRVQAKMLSRHKKKAHGFLHEIPHEALCNACQAWEDGMVLVHGERRYTVTSWVFVNAQALRKYNERP